MARWNRRRRLDQWVRSSASGWPWSDGHAVAAGHAHQPVPPADPGRRTRRARWSGPIVALAAACLAVVPPLVLPASTMSDIGVTVGANQPSAWAEWNYSGYERSPTTPSTTR